MNFKLLKNKLYQTIIADFNENKDMYMFYLSPIIFKLKTKDFNKYNYSLFSKIKNKEITTFNIYKLKTYLKKDYQKDIKTIIKTIFKSDYIDKDNIYALNHIKKIISDKTKFVYINLIYRLLTDGKNKIVGGFIKGFNFLKKNKKTQEPKKLQFQLLKELNITKQVKHGGTFDNMDKIIKTINLNKKLKIYYNIQELESFYNNNITQFNNINTIDEYNAQLQQLNEFEIFLNSFKNNKISLIIILSFVYYQYCNIFNIEPMLIYSESIMTKFNNIFKIYDENEKIITISFLVKLYIEYIVFFNIYNYISQNASGSIDKNKYIKIKTLIDDLIDFHDIEYILYYQQNVDSNPAYQKSDTGFDKSLYIYKKYYITNFILFDDEISNNSINYKGLLYLYLYANIKYILDLITKINDSDKKKLSELKTIFEKFLYNIDNIPVDHYDKEKSSIYHQLYTIISKTNYDNIINKLKDVNIVSSEEIKSQIQQNNDGSTSSPDHETIIEENKTIIEENKTIIKENNKNIETLKTTYGVHVYQTKYFTTFLNELEKETQNSKYNESIEIYNESIEIYNDELTHYLKVINTHISNYNNYNQITATHIIKLLDKNKKEITLLDENEKEITLINNSTYGGGNAKLANNKLELLLSYIFKNIKLV
jgi:hypothetical protein